MQLGSLSLSGIKGVCRLIRIDNSVAVKVVAVPEIISTLCDAMEAPFKVTLYHI
jgi:Na+/serine symporter